MDEMHNETKTPESAPNTVGTKFCPRCGKQLPESAAFCGECGLNLGASSAAFNTPPAPAEDTSPLKTGDYFVMLLLFALPFVGLIMMCVWAFSGNTNVNRRNFSRANLIWFAIAAVLSVFLWSALLAVVGFFAGAIEGTIGTPFFFG